MTKRERVWCLVLGLLGCIISTLLLYRIFDFGQETGVGIPLVVGVIILVQLMDLVLERLGSR